MNYKILFHTNRSQLENIVEQHINECWNLQGGVAVAVKDGDDSGYFQAVTKN